MSRDLEAIFKAIWYPKCWAKSCLLDRMQEKHWNETCTKIMRRPNTQSSQVQVQQKHSSILCLSLRQYVEQRTDITFTLLPVSFTFLEPMQIVSSPLPSSSLFLSFWLNLLSEPMHVCNLAHMRTLQRLAIWSTFWLPTTFLSFWNLCRSSRRLCRPVPYGPMQRLCHPAHFFLLL